MVTVRDLDRDVRGDLASPDRDAGRAHPVRRAVDGTPYVDHVSSSLGFAAFLEDCYASLSSSLELIGDANFEDATGGRTMSKRPARQNRLPHHN